MKLFNDLHTSTLDIHTCAQIILKLIKSKASGIYNLGSKDRLSKKAFAILFAKMNKFEIKYSNISCNSGTVKRSNFLGLNLNKIEKKLKFKMMSSEEVVKNLIKQSKNLKKNII